VTAEFQCVIVASRRCSPVAHAFINTGLALVMTCLPPDTDDNCSSLSSVVTVSATLWEALVRRSLLRRHHRVSFWEECTVALIAVSKRDEGHIERGRGWMPLGSGRLKAQPVAACGCRSLTASPLDSGDKTDSSIARALVRRSDVCDRRH